LASQHSSSEASGSGFTLIELVVTVAIAVVFLTLAAPSMLGLIQDDNKVSKVNLLVSGLDYARDEAIKQDATVYVCPYNASSPPSVYGCDSSQNWALGWLVYCNSAGTGAANACTPSGTVLTALRTYPALPAGLTLSSTTPNGLLGFASTGVIANATPGAFYSFKFCDSAGAAQAHELEVNSLGRVQAAAVVGTDVSGAGLTCP
jgi:type IV fimbrial biogenesis protein FimT